MLSLVDFTSSSADSEFGGFPLRFGALKKKGPGKNFCDTFILTSPSPKLRDLSLDQPEIPFRVKVYDMFCVYF